MVEDGKCALFCEFVKSIHIGSGFEPVLLQIKHIYIADESMNEKKHISLENIGRVGMEFLVDSRRVK